MAAAVGRLSLVGRSLLLNLSSSSHSRPQRLVALLHHHSGDFQHCRLVSTSPRHGSTACTKDMRTLDEIVDVLMKIAPLQYAADWDNVGLLVEPSPDKFVGKIMLTNDLTCPVVEEAKNKKVDLIISYHPPIFKPLKRLCQRSWKERVLVQCIENRIAVFSPHTSHDVIPLGVNDWLLSAFDVIDSSVCAIEKTCDFVDGNTHVLEVDVEWDDLPNVRDKSLVNYLPSQSRLKTDKDLFTMHPIKLSTDPDSALWRLHVDCREAELDAMVKGLIASDPCAKYSVTLLSKVPLFRHGFGRRAELEFPILIEAAVEKVKEHLGISHVSVALALDKKDVRIKSVAVCAGSGSVVLNGVKADLLVTGELSHHEVLDAISSGSHVILCHHSNTERGYLKKFREQLVSLVDDSVEIFVSEADQEPLQVV